MSKRTRSSIRLGLDLVVILCLSLLLITTIYSLPIPALRIILGAPFVLFFPGYTLVAALFPGKDDPEGIERVGLSLGLSIAVLPLMGLALNYTPLGITLFSTLVSATLFMLVTCGIAYFRRGRLPAEERFVLRIELDVAGWRRGGLLDKSLTAALALSVVGALGTFLFVLGRPEVGERFTEFYLLQSTGRAKVYPAEIPANWPIPLIVGVVNREHDDVQYRVEMQVSGQEPEQIADIRLAQDEKWEKRVTFSLAEPGEDQKVSFHLYKELEEEPYRSLHLWIDVLPSGAPLRAETPPPAAPPTPDISQTAEVSPSPAPAPQATPPPSPSASPTGGPTSTPVGRTVHIVQPGETLSSIARLYGVAYEAIMYANGLEDPNLVEVGQELTIPHLDEILPTLTLTPAQE